MLNLCRGYILTLDTCISTYLKPKARIRIDAKFRPSAARDPDNFMYLAMCPVDVSNGWFQWISDVSHGYVAT